MSTGYTYKIKDGISFREYALSCAKAFGALYHQREESLETELSYPKKSSYKQTRVTQAEKELKRYQQMTLQEAKEIRDSLHQRGLKSDEESLQESQKLELKYTEMLKQVDAYTPPSEDHLKFKQFMRSQITESIKFDCRSDLYKNRRLVKKTPVKKWYDIMLKGAEADLVRAKEALEKENKQHQLNIVWIDQLKESLEVCV